MPAPTRSSSDSFPQRWGYGVGFGLIVLGVVLAAVIIVGGFVTLYQDVRNFERAVGRGEVIADLEAGEYTIYDERDGLSLGPFNVTVERLSDGATIPADPVSNGAEYNVDGRSGEARASVRIPTAGQYKIDVSASPGSVLSFAIGKGTVTGPTGFVGRGLGLLALFGIAGVGLLLWTAYKHAQWRVRGALDQRLEQGRELVNATVGATADRSAGPQTAVPGRIDALAGRAREAVERARAEAAKFGGPQTPPTAPPPAGERPAPTAANPEPPDWVSAMADRAGAAIDATQERVQAGAGDANQRLASEADAAARALDEAITRVQARLRSGESLRSIVRDEGPAAVEGAQAQFGRATAAADAARAEAALAVERARAQVTAQGAGAGADLAADVAGVRSAAGDQVRSAVDDARSDAAPIAGELLGDVGVVAAGAVGAAAAAVAAVADDLTGGDLGFEDLVVGWRPGDEPVTDAPGVEPPPAAADHAAVATGGEVAPPASVAPVGTRAIESAPFARPLPVLRPVAGAASRHAAGILAPPPIAQLRALDPSSRPGPRTGASGDAPSSSDADADADVQPRPSDRASDAGMREGGAESKRGGSTFSLAPPPDYRTLRHKPGSGPDAP